MKPLLSSLAFVAAALTSTAAQASILEILTDTFPIPATSQAQVTLRNTAPYNVDCTVQIKAIIRGRVNGFEVTATKQSAPLRFELDQGTSYAYKFSVAAAVTQMRTTWGDPTAIVVDIDRTPGAMVETCQRRGGSSPTPPPPQDTPDCESAMSDPDGDGWGWENQRSCRVAPGSHRDVHFSGRVFSNAVSKCLEVPKGHYERNEYQHVQMWSCYPGPNMDWTYDGEEMRSPNGRCLEVLGPTGAEYRPVHSRPCSGGSSQKWTFRDDGDIRSADGLCLQFRENNVQDGTQLMVARCNNGRSPRWNFR